MMRTFAAKYQDVPDVVRYLREQHDGTGWEFVPVETKVLRETVTAMVRTQDIADVLVAKDKEGKIRGVLLASIDRFLWAKKHYASSCHFVAAGGGPSLLRTFKDWAQRRKCVCIIEAVATDDPRATAFLEAGGFKRIGGALVCYLADQPQEEVA